MSKLERLDLVIDTGGATPYPNDLFVVVESEYERNKEFASNVTSPVDVNIYKDWYYVISLDQPQMGLLHLYEPKARKLCSVKDVPLVAGALYCCKSIFPGGTSSSTFAELINQLERVVFKFSGSPKTYALREKLTSGPRQTPCLNPSPIERPANGNSSGT